MLLLLLFFFFTPNAAGLRSNDVCDGENEDEFDDEDFMDSLVYRRAVERAVGARDRLVVGLVGEADVPCGEGMVCRRVSRDRRECRDVVEGFSHRPCEVIYRATL